MERLSNELLNEAISNLTEDVIRLKKNDTNDMLITATAWLMFLEELKEYRDAEEQGLLLRLPCKVGMSIWVNGVLGCGEAEEHKVIKVDYHSTLGTGRNEFYIGSIVGK